MKKIWIRFTAFMNSRIDYSQGPGGMVQQWRAARMKVFLDSVRPPSGARIIDLGGTPWMWELIDHDFDVTLVNLTNEFAANLPDKTCYHYVEGDATNLRDQYADNHFDVVFSNSVIEHVGDAAHQASFASEVKRLAPAYWIQTPSDHFPIEPHTHIPYYFKLPKAVTDRLIKSWRKELPVWTEMIEGTTVLPRKRMVELFPEASMFTERKFGFEKSYAAFRSANR
jgi:trans-aconitate methyltransferase